jgi:hypothetical protein
VTQEFAPLTVESRLVTSQGDPEPVRDGTSRQVDGDAHAWIARPGDWAAYIFPELADVHEVSLALDSDLERGIYYSWNEYRVEMESDVPEHLGRLRRQPPMMPSVFHIDGLVDGEWRTLKTVTGNHQRFVRLPIDQRLEGVRFVLDETWGGQDSRVYAFYVD